MTQQADLFHFSKIHTTLKFIKDDMIMGNNQSALQKTSDLLKFLESDILPKIFNKEESELSSDVAIA